MKAIRVSIYTTNIFGILGFYLYARGPFNSKPINTMHRLLLIALACSIVITAWFSLFPESRIWPNRPLFLKGKSARIILSILLLIAFGLYFGFALVDPGQKSPHDAFIDPNITIE